MAYGKRILKSCSMWWQWIFLLFYDAYLHGADIYITGDIKYHDAQYGQELGLTIVDAGLIIRRR